uniref:Uncharacterized protein n=1 Tax=Aegilops tauschii subsp. strangulata TaxID=200361 RepID=A0A453ANY3_AEGTS
RWLSRRPAPPSPASSPPAASSPRTSPPSPPGASSPAAPPSTSSRSVLKLSIHDYAFDRIRRPPLSSLASPRIRRPIRTYVWSLGVRVWFL